MLGIFIEPKYELRNYIVKWKLKIKKKYSNTKYINHPPHLTLFFANISKENKAIEAIENVANQLKSFKIHINQAGIFVNDAFTGKDTIYLKINKNRKIYLLQKKIANNLKFLVNKRKLNNFKNLNNNLKKSFLNYGYPFVGTHWKPHFTIGSINNFKNKEEYKKFFDKKINFTNEVKVISLWRINQKKHTKIKDFKFIN